MKWYCSLRSARDFDRRRRYAVVGGGFAGVAVAWHLLASATSAQPVDVTLFDGVGLGAGGSGAAAGLLHPFTPRGKVLWRGREALEAALKLVAEAEAAQAACVPGVPTETFVWRHPILRPATTLKQARDFAKFAADSGPGVSSRAISVDEAVSLMPGLALPLGPNVGSDKSDGTEPLPAALLVEGGCVLDPKHYLTALWAACTYRAAAAASRADLVLARVTSLRDLEASHGPFDAVVAAGGAAMGCITELDGLLPLELCQGYSLHLAATTTPQNLTHPTPDPAPPPPLPNPGVPDPPKSVNSEGVSGLCGANSGGMESEKGVNSEGVQTVDGTARVPLDGNKRALDSVPPHPSSVLGPIYLAAHGPTRLVVGATKRGGLTPAEAWAECGRLVGPAQRDGLTPAEASGECGWLEGPMQGDGLTPAETSGECARLVGPTQRGGLTPAEASARERGALLKETLGEGPPVEAGPPGCGEKQYAFPGGSMGLSATVGEGGRVHVSAEESLARKKKAAEGGEGEGGRGDERAAAIEALLPGAAALWAPAGGPGWMVSDVRTGVRALPPRTPDGSLPLAGRLDAAGRSWWVIGGLGARGLVYHAWLGQVVAEAVLQGDEGLLPPELLRWKPGQKAL